MCSSWENEAYRQKIDDPAANRTPGSDIFYSWAWPSMSEPGGKQVVLRPIGDVLSAEAR